MGFYRNEYEAEQEGYNHEAYQRLNEELKQEAAAMSVPYEQYKLGHTLLILNGTREGAERRKQELELAKAREHQRQQAQERTVRTAPISSLISALVAKAPMQFIGDKLQYSKTGHMPEPLKEWVIAQFDGVKQ